jgi:hypothetical protein
MVPLAGSLATAALAFFAVFTAALVSAFPLRLLDPVWQLAVCGLLISNGVIPLVGLISLHLASYLDPDNQDLERRLASLARWAILAVLGFLLLIPLQGVAAWRNYSERGLQQSSQLRTVLRQIEQRRLAVKAAFSPEDLQARLRQAGSPPLGPGDLAQPLPLLKQQVMGALQMAETQARQQLPAPDASQAWTAAQESLRVCLSALALALGFAALSRRRDSELSLLQEWQLGRQQQRHQSLLRRERRGGSFLPRKGSGVADEEYFREISDPPLETEARPPGP